MSETWYERKMKMDGKSSEVVNNSSHRTSLLQDYKTEFTFSKNKGTPVAKMTCVTDKRINDDSWIGLRQISSDNKKPPIKKVETRITHDIACVLSPIPDPDMYRKHQRDVYYISGPSGSGKSTVASFYMKNYNEIFPEHKIFIFSAVPTDPAFKGIKNIYRVMLDESFPDRLKEVEEESSESECIEDSYSSDDAMEYGGVSYGYTGGDLGSSYDDESTCFETGLTTTEYSDSESKNECPQEVSKIPEYPTDKERIYTGPINFDVIGSSLCIFDDIDVVSNPAAKKAVQELRNRCLEIGRHAQVSMIVTTHQLMNYRETKIVIMEATKVVVFPLSGARRQIRRFFESYTTLDKKNIDEIFKLKTRWVCVSKTYPQYILYSGGIYLTE